MKLIAIRAIFASLSSSAWSRASLGKKLKISPHLGKPNAHCPTKTMQQIIPTQGRPNSWQAHVTPVIYEGFLK